MLSSRIIVPFDETMGFPFWYNHVKQYAVLLAVSNRQTGLLDVVRTKTFQKLLTRHDIHASPQTTAKTSTTLKSSQFILSTDCDNTLTITPFAIVQQMRKTRV